MRCFCRGASSSLVDGRKSVEVFDEALDLWLHLPCDLPVNGKLYCMGSHHAAINDLNLYMFRVACRRR